MTETKYEIVVNGDDEIVASFIAEKFADLIDNYEPLRGRQVKSFEYGVPLTNPDRITIKIELGPVRRDI